MATTSPARIDDDLYASAKLVGAVQSRSASQQVVHWARIGREIEVSAAISQKEIAEVLGGSRSYDALGAKDQAIVRAEWSTRMDALRKELNLAQEFEAAGRSWVELGVDGQVAGKKVVGKKVVGKKAATGKTVAKKRKRAARVGATKATKPVKPSGQAGRVRPAR